MADLAEVLEGCKGALQDEIDAVREQGNRALHLFDGELLNAQQGEWVYRFGLDEDAYLPDDSPAQLKAGDRTIECAVIGTEASHLFLSVQEDLGEEISEAQLLVDLTYLIEALRDAIAERLELADDSILREVIGAKAWSDRSLCSSLDFPSFGNANEAQKAAIRKVCSGGCTFIWGPPGTGKTWTIGALVAAHLRHGKSVLVTSHTNVAVDNAILDAIETPEVSPYLNDGKIIRLGVPRLPQLQDNELVSVQSVAARQMPALLGEKRQLEAELRGLREQRRVATRAHRRSEVRDLEVRMAQVRRALNTIYRQLKSLEDSIVAGAMALGLTLSKLAASEVLAERTWDLVVVDEASMAWIPQVVLAGIHARSSLAVIGDFRQLAPVSLANTHAAKLWLHRDVFTLAGVTQAVEQQQPPKNLIMLNEQRRMHPAISAVPNKLVYRGQLIDESGLAEKRAQIAKAEPWPGKALVAVACDELGGVCYRETLLPGMAWKSSRSRYNFISAAAAVHLAALARQVYSQPDPDGERPIAIISPYAAQFKLIRKMVHDLGYEDSIIVSTVHRFQGSEADVVIVELPDSYPRKRPGILMQGEFGSSAMRLMNVAITRARGKLIVLGDFGYLASRLSGRDVFSQLIDLLFRTSRVETLRTRSFPAGLGSGAGAVSDRSSFIRQLATAKTIDVVLCEASNPIATIAEAAPRSARLRLFVAPTVPKLNLTSLSHLSPDVLKLKWRPVTTTVIVDGVLAIVEPFARGERIWSPHLMMRFPTAFKWWLSILEKDCQGSASSSRDGIARWLGEDCPDHGVPLRLVKSGSNKLSLGCPLYSSRNCRYVKFLEPDDLTPLLANRPCPRCRNLGLAVRSGGYGWFVGCLRWPACNWTSGIEYVLRLSGSTGPHLDVEDEDDE